jgi:predicted house-cleaning noncanonical NTP pyrophosphatase (MazG superfamily)
MKAKLIRDNIPSIINKSGRKAITALLENLSDKEQLKFKKQKLKEELLEFQVAESHIHKIQEMADILEVIECFFDDGIVLKLKQDSLESISSFYSITKMQIGLFDLDLDAIIIEKNNKQMRTGSFHNGIILLSIEE